ncbi:MAG: ABC transporter ATP-binding protein [Pseudonocardiales bacterium]|nr:ABC transporter ATP-binding protein [Pseudonocardiales bacterium]MBV9028938.1 ABC transporter ATP-binding protein [Pseudonocardiales bacterium]MBW0010262.1 ABC transporter ATP-binding protein [Pseudonocardiales bacterium]
MGRPVRPAPVETDGLTPPAPSLRVRDIFTRFWPDARPFRVWLGLSLTLVVVAPLLDTATIWLFKLLIDDVLTVHSLSAFPPIAITYLAITVVLGVVEFTDDYLTAWIGESFLHRLRTRVFTHLQTLSAGFFDTRPLGDTLSRLTGDLSAIENLVLSGVTGIAAQVVKIGLFAGVLFYLSWQLTSVSLIAVPICWLTARFFSRRIKVASREVRRRGGSINAMAEESLGNTLLIQVYNRQQAEITRFTEQSRRSVTAELAATRLRAMFSPLVNLLEVAGVMVVIGMGVWELTSNRITLGGLLVFLAYLSQLYSPARGLGQLSTTVYAAAAGAERVIDLLDQQPDVRAPTHPVPLPHPHGTISLDQVGFRYPGATTDALNEISFTVEPGHSLALVGTSGAGKTTLTKLLLRLHDPSTGAVRLDGIDARDLDPHQLRATMSAVLQETLLLDGTIAENILAGRPDATQAELVTAATAADAHEFIIALPEGYDTRVGQRGRLLSGGQRQRIAIARAMIRNTPVLILDEPTTGLDTAAGERILTPLRRLMTGRTTIVISHDLATVTEVDQIIHLDHGRIIDTGTHSQLLARNGDYARLYRTHRRRPHRATEVSAPA